MKVPANVPPSTPGVNPKESDRLSFDKLFRGEYIEAPRLAPEEPAFTDVSHHRRLLRGKSR